MQNQTWLDNLKIAIINKKIDNLVELSKELPTFDSLEDLKTAQALVVQARDLIIKEQSKVAQDMKKNRQIKNFLENQR